MEKGTFALGSGGGMHRPILWIFDDVCSDSTLLHPDHERFETEGFPCGSDN